MGAGGEEKRKEVEEEERAGDLKTFWNISASWLKTNNSVPQEGWKFTLTHNMVGTVQNKLTRHEQYLVP